MGLKFTRLVDKDVIPTKVSQLENDSNYQNEEQVDAKVNAITKENLGLDKVDNTSDMDKPISTLTQKALDLKANSSDVYDKLSVENKLAQKEDKINLKALAYKDQLNKADVGLGNVNNVAITQEEVTQIGTNKTNIENTNKQVSTNIQHISNAQSTANEALNIAKGRAKTKVFDTFGDMTNYLKSASKDEFKLGDNLLIKATSVPDYWISNILDNNSGIYGYYEISVLETTKVDLSNYYNKGEIDTKETNINNKIDTKADKTSIPTKTSQLENDSNFLTQHQDLSNYYTKTEVYNKTESDNKYQVQGDYALKSELFSKDYNDLTNKPTIPTTLPASDVYSWAKQPNKPTYSASEVGAYTKAESDEKYALKGESGGSVTPENVYTKEEVDNKIQVVSNDLENYKDNIGLYNTFVPKAGFIEKVYLNIFLPKEKIVELLSTLDFSTNTHYTIVKSRSTMYEIYVEQYDGHIRIKFAYPSSPGSTTSFHDTLFDALVNNYKETNGFNMELIGEDGSVVFNEEAYPYETHNPYANEQLVDIFSTKPFNENNLVNKVRNLEYGLENTYTKEEIDKLQHKLGELDFAQPIRENEYVEKIYVNTSLTYEEIAEIIDSLEMPDGKTTYYLYISEDNTKQIYLYTDTYSIRYYQKGIGTNYIYMNRAFVEDFINNTNGIIEINAKNQFSEDTNEFIQNKKLTRLFSTTPVFGLSSLEEKIDNLEKTKSNKSEVYTKLEVDGKIEEINEQLVLKANSSDVYTRTEINNLLANFSSLDIEVVTTLPTTNISTTTIYLKPLTTSATQNVYEEYIYINNKWEVIGTTQVDLSNYYKKSETYSQNEIDTQLADKVSYDTFESVLTQASQQIGAIAKTVEDVNERIDIGSVTEIGAIPNSGTLDTLYINTSMSTSEVNALIDQVGTYYSQLGGRLYQVLQNVDNDILMIMLSSGTNYQIMFNLRGSLVTIYNNGWVLDKLPEGYENGIYIGSELVSSSSATGITVSVGHKNDQLIDLLYTKVSKPIPINEEVKNNTNEITKLDKQLNAKVGGSGGAIPSSGYVDTVYINTNLSTEQVLDIIALDKLDYVLLAEEETGEKMYAYFVLGTEPTTPTAVEDGFDTMIGIMLMTDADDNVFASQIIASVVTTSEDDDGDRIIWYYDIESGTGMFDPQGIGISEFVVQGEALTEAMGMSVGTSNDKLVDLMNIGATSGSAKSFYEKMNELYDYVGEVKSGATTVPNSGTVEKIYFNTSLSTEEVVNILSQLDYHDFAGNEAYCIAFPENIDVALLVMRIDGVYGILNIFAENELDGTYFMSEDVGNGVVGWKEGFDGVIEINDTVSDYQGYYELPLGEQNDKLTNLVSLTPSFEKPKTLTERVDSLDEKIGDYEIHYVKEIEGTPVPDTGVIEKIYINTDLSVDEVRNMLSKLDYVADSLEGDETYLIAHEINGGAVFSVNKVLNDYFINYSGLGDEYIKIFSTKTYEGVYDFTGFNPNFNGEIEIGWETHNSTGSNGKPVGQQNDIIKNLISTTPVSKEEITNPTIVERLDKVENELNGYESESEPTVVPNSGMVEKAYFNTALSNEEISDICSQLTFYDFNGINVYPIFSNNVGNNVLFIVQNMSVFELHWTNDITDVFSSTLIITTGNAETDWIFNEWSLNDNGVNSLQGLPIGTQNELIKNLVSITPFGVMETHKGLIERVSELEKNGGGGSLPTDENGNLVFDDYDKGIQFNAVGSKIYEDSNTDTLVFDTSIRPRWKIGDNEYKELATLEDIGTSSGSLPTDPEFNSVRVRDESNNTDFGFSCIWEDGIEYETRDGEAFNIYFPEKSGTLATLNDFLIEITYDELKALRDNGNLIAGMQYKIVDYITTTTQENTRSVGNQFDIIVVADSKNTLNENARASLHNGDTYFANSKLNAWKLKYCLDNDTSRFAWAIEGQAIVNIETALSNGNFLVRQPLYDGKLSDIEYQYAWGTQADVDDDDYANFIYSKNETLTNGEVVYNAYTDIEEIVEIITGKGVIYRMIDEFENDLPYDFKNIQYKRYAVVECDNESFIYDYSSNPFMYGLITKGGETLPNNATLGESDWFYTFSGIEQTSDGENILYDVSTHPHRLSEQTIQDMINDDSAGDEQDNCSNNKIGKLYSIDVYSGILFKGKSELNNIVFYSLFYDYGYDDSYSISKCCCNTIEDNCHFNTIGEDFACNEIGSYFYNNTIGNNFHTNAIGKYFRYNVIDSSFSINTINSNFHDNIIGGGFSENIVGNNFHSNTIGNGCYGNTIGNAFYYNTIGEYFYENTIGNNFASNTIGSYFGYNTIGERFSKNTTETDFFVNMIGSNVHDNIIGVKYCYYNIFENNIGYLKLVSNVSTTQMTLLENIKICQGIEGSSTKNPLVITVIVTTSVQREFKMKGSITNEIEV